MNTSIEHKYENEFIDAIIRMCSHSEKLMNELTQIKKVKSHLKRFEKEYGIYDLDLDYAFDGIQDKLKQIEQSK